jgi:hypothetical protein
MLVDTKSQLAKLLATENITIEQRKVATASFHIKDRLLILPILSEELSSWLYDLFCGHEVGHALYTPEEGWHDSVVDLKIPKSILNVTEDARIEKLIKRKYPGLRVSFTKAYRELMERDFFDIANVDVNELNFVDRLNLHFKVGSSLGIRFNEIETPIVQEMENLETWEDTVRVSCIILELMKEQNKQKKEQNASEDFNADDENDSADEYEEDYGDEEESGEESNEQEEVESEEIDEGGTDIDAAEDDMEEIKSFTDDSFREREKELLSNETMEPVYADIPEVDLKKVIMSYKEVISRLKNENVNSENKDFLTNYDGTLDTSYFTEFRRKSNNVVSYLVKEFELRKNAEQMKKASVSKTGDLDLKRIHSYKFSEDLFRRVTNVPNGKSHGIVMFIDWSGSMGMHLNETVKQLLNLVLFCRKVNIPYEVYAFSNYNSPLENINPISDIKSGELILEHFRLLNVISSKMTTNEFNYVASCLLKMTKTNDSKYYSNYTYPRFMSLSGTPLNEAIISAMQIVPKFQEDNKLQIVNTVFLTDGEGHTISDIHQPYTEKSGTTYNIGTSALAPWRKISPVFRHKKTGLFEKSKDTKSNNYTAALIRMLKKVTNTNIVGFYLLSSRDAYSYLNSNFTNLDAINYLRSEFRRNKSIVVKNSGFDEYYLMKADTDVDELETIEAKTNTTRGLVNAFTKYSNTRVTNRIVLNKFIGMIA